jgi:hypothetical protein
MKKKLSDQAIVFESQLERESGGMRFHFLEFPHDVKTLFGVKGQVRVIVEINGHSFKRSLIPSSSGYHKIIAGELIRKTAGIKIGDKVKCQLKIDPEKPKLIIPEELSAVFEIEEPFHATFKKFPPGMQRQICGWIAEGKKEETRVKRAIEMLRRFETGKFHFGGREK